MHIPRFTSVELNNILNRSRIYNEGLTGINVVSKANVLL